MSLPPSTSTPAARDEKFRRYCSTGIGVAVLAGVVTTTDASIVFTDYGNTLYKDTNTGDNRYTYYDFDFNHDGITDFSLSARQVGPGSTAPRNATALTTSPDKPSVDVVGITATSGGQTYFYPSRLTLNTVIGPGAGFITLGLGGPPGSSYLIPGFLAAGNGFPNSKWTTAGANSGFLGIRFTIGSEVHYGWVGLTVTPENSTNPPPRSFTVSGIAYETTANTPIAAGAVPEPSTLALVALGSAGLAVYRRRRAASRDAAASSRDAATL